MSTKAGGMALGLCILFTIFLPVALASCTDPVLLENVRAVVDEERNPAPKIVSPSTSNGGTLSSLGMITITFDSAMDTDSLELSGSMSEEAGVLSWDLDSVRVSINPADHWSAGTNRSLTVSCDGENGKTAQATFSFTIPAPALLTAEPASGAVLDWHDPITITFSMAMETTSLSLSGDLGGDVGTEVGASWSDEDEDGEVETVTLVPPDAWEAGSARTLVIDCSEAGGNPITPYTLALHVLDGAVYVSGSSGSDDNPGTYDSPKKQIAGALDTASDIYRSDYPGTVKLDAGTYWINDEYPATLSPGVSLSGGYAYPDWDTYDPQGKVTELKDGRVSGIYTTVTVPVAAGEGIVVQGLTITGGGGDSGTLVTVGDGSRPVLRDLVLKAGTAESNYGIWFAGGGTAYNNFFDLGTASGVAVLVDGGAPVLRNNTIIGGAADAGRYGVWMQGGAEPAIDNNILTISAGGTTVALRRASAQDIPVSVRNNIFYGWTTALYRDASSGTFQDHTGVAGMEDALSYAGAEKVADNGEADPLLDGRGVPLDSASAAVLEGGLDGSVADGGWGFTDDAAGSSRTGDGGTGWTAGAFEVDI